MGAFDPYPVSKNRVTRLLTSDNFFNENGRKLRIEPAKKEALISWKIVFKSSR